MLVSNQLIAQLFESPDPSVHYLARVHLLGDGLYTNLEADHTFPALASLQEDIRSSQRVQALLSGCGPDGRIMQPVDAPYCGSHWVLGCLAEIGYPPGDAQLIPLREQVYDWLFSEGQHSPASDGRRPGSAASMGYALYALVTLGLADKRSDQLADRLIDRQRPEGGWNSSEEQPSPHWTFAESLAALRGLVAYTKSGASKSAKRAAERAAARAAEVFLSHNLFEVLPLPGVLSDSLLLHFPGYARYDVLAALVVMNEGGWLGDHRCRPALEWLEKKQLPTGGFPMEKKLYQTQSAARRGFSPVEWGPAGRRAANPFTTIQALGVLQAAGVTWMEPIF